MTDSSPDCPFCAIAAAHPWPSDNSDSEASVTVSKSPYSYFRFPKSPSSTAIHDSASQHHHQHKQSTNPSQASSSQQQQSQEQNTQITQTDPPSYVILSTKHVLAFLDIQPITRGHVLVIVRRHCVRVSEVRGVEGAEVSSFVYRFHYPV